MATGLFRFSVERDPVPARPAVVRRPGVCICQDGPCRGKVLKPRLPDRFDVYYEMAGNRIGVARLDLPDRLPDGADADPPGARV